MVFNRQSTFRGFSIKRGQVVARFLHHLNGLVVANAVLAFGIRSVDIGIEGTCRSMSIALNTGYLHQAANRVARHTEMMFQAHFSGIFCGLQASAKDVVGRSGCHSASHAHLSLTSCFSARD